MVVGRLAPRSTGAKGGETLRGLPEINLRYWKPLLVREVIDEPGNVLGCWVAINQVERLPQFLQRGHGWIVSMKDHAMIQGVVNPSTDNSLNVGKVDHHAPLIETIGGKRNHGPTIVTVEEAALSVVIQQTMSVTKIDLSCNSKHDTFPFRTHSTRDDDTP